MARNASTQHPVVLLHGVFGYGKNRPPTASSKSSSERARRTRALKFNRLGSLRLERSESVEDDGKHPKTRFERGQWHVLKVASNHKAGTSFDLDSPVLFRPLLRLIAREFEK